MYNYSKLNFNVNPTTDDNDYINNEAVKEVYEMLSDDNQWAVNETFNIEKEDNCGKTTIIYNKRRCWRNFDGKELSIRVVLADCCDFTTDDCDADLEIEKECDIYTFVNIYIPSGRLNPNSVKAVIANFDGHEFELDSESLVDMYNTICKETPYGFLTNQIP